MSAGTKRVFVGVSFLLSFLCGFGAEEIHRTYQQVFAIPEAPLPSEGTESTIQGAAESSGSVPPQPTTTLLSPPEPDFQPGTRSMPPLPALQRERRNEYDSLFRAPEGPPSQPPPENPYEQLNALVPSSPPPIEGAPAGFAPPQVSAQEEVSEEEGDEEVFEEEEIGASDEVSDESLDESDVGTVDEGEESFADEEGVE